jgi:hypothetical protein
MKNKKIPSEETFQIQGAGEAGEKSLHTEKHIRGITDMKGRDNMEDEGLERF